MRQPVRVLLIVWTAVMVPALSFAQTPQSRAPAPALSAPAPAPALSAAQPTKDQSTAMDKTVAALEAQTAEMKRSEDRLLLVIVTAMGMVPLAAFALAAFGWWSTTRLYQRDLDTMREALLEQLRADHRRTLADFEQKFESERQAWQTSTQARFNGQILDSAAELRLKFGDTVGSIEVACLQFIEAQKVNDGEAKRRALGRLRLAFQEAGKQQLAINPIRIQLAREFVSDYRSYDHSGADEFSKVIDKIAPPP